MDKFFVYCALLQHRSPRREIQQRSVLATFIILIHVRCCYCTLLCHTEETHYLSCILIPPYSTLCETHVLLINKICCVSGGEV